jgi:hypothetical protein
MTEDEVADGRERGLVGLDAEGLTEVELEEGMGADLRGMIEVRVRGEFVGEDGEKAIGDVGRETGEEGFDVEGELLYDVMVLSGESLPALAVIRIVTQTLDEGVDYRAMALDC